MRYFSLVLKIEKNNELKAEDEIWKISEKGDKARDVQKIYN